MSTEEGAVMADNLKMSVDKNVLTIQVDLSKEQGPSKSGKNVIIATSGGNMEVPGGKGAKIGINVYKPK